MPVVTFDRERHAYRVDGRAVLYVSQVLDLAGLGVDYTKIPPATLQHARERGEHVDLCCDLFDADDLAWESVHPEAVPYVRAWASFREREGFKSIVRQAVVYHPVLDYAGTADAYGLIGGAAVLVERKCTSKLSPTYALQAALYAMPGISWAADDTPGELLPFDAERRLIVQLKNDGSYTLYDCEQEARKAGRDDFAAARGAIEVARWRLTNGNGRTA